MTAALAHRPAAPSPITGGDRLYAIARWLLLIIIFVLATVVYQVALLPPTAGERFGQIFWAYVFFALLGQVLVLLPQTQRLVPWSYVCDLLWLAALAYVGPGAPLSYVALFLLPLIAGALRLQRVAVLGLSIFAVALSQALLFKPHISTDVLAFASQAIMLGILPWLVNLLSEQWTVDNRQRVLAAQEQSAAALKHAETYRDRMRALYEVALSLNTTGNAADVLETTLHECRRFLPCHEGAIVLPTGAPDQVQVVAGRHLQPNEIGATFMVSNGTLGAVLRGANGGVLHNAHTDPAFARLPSIRERRTVLILPLRSARRTFGLVLFGSDEAQLTVEQMDMATTLVSYGLVALQNAQLIAELRAERENLLAREEEVRKQLNRDLHDGPAQSLAAITMTLGFIKRLYAKEPARMVPELDKLAAMAQRANHDVRTLLFELRPLVLETQGLMPTLRQYLERFEQNGTGPQVVLEGDDEIGPLTKRVQGTLFNIVQESTNNALKHAEAQHIWIKIAKKADELMLTIQDDGKGFDLQAVKAAYDQRGSFGLLSLEERARLVGGHAELLSAPGAGTTVRVVVPLDP